MGDAPPTAGVAVRFLVVAQMPMLVMGLGDDEAGDQLWTRLAMAGLAELPGFYGVDFPRGATVGFTVGTEHLRLEDEDAVGLLQLPRPSVDPTWLEAAKRMKGTMASCGRQLELDPDADDQTICDELHTAALDGRLRGAIVGVAEPRLGLPLFFT